jgi:hypothetical protein
MTASATTNLTDWSTDQLKEHLIELTQGRDTDFLSQKNKFLKQKLFPFFEELSRRNPNPHPRNQLPLVTGIWQPVWSTIPFQDIFPGRVRSQSYQIFHDDGYYANIARYAPGHKLPFIGQLTSMLVSWDLMIIQRYAVQDEQWYIENVGVEQTLRASAVPLNAQKADGWFNKAMEKLAEKAGKQPIFERVDTSTAKRLKSTYQAKPKLEHLYIDSDFRLVRSKREEKQRDSYTITVRLK